jgi:transmembrane sensor
MPSVGNAEIDTIASDWVARLDRGSPGETDQQRLAAWLAADPRHKGAYLRAQAVWHALDRGRALAVPPMRAIDAPVASTRRYFVGGAAAAIAASVAGFLWIGRTPTAPTLRFATKRREIRTLALSDGSRTIVNAGSDISFAFDDAHRVVRLARGEGWFDVAKDRDRPFIVKVGGIEARAVGTAFAVSRGEKAIAVTVTEGIVEVAGPRGAVRVAAGGRAEILPSGEMTISPLDPGAIDRELAWRDHRVVMEGETLLSAAGRFNQYNDVEIVIDDARLAQEPVVGTFDLREPEEFARGIATAFQAHVERRRGKLVLSYSG